MRFQRNRERVGIKPFDPRTTGGRAYGLPDASIISKDQYNELTVEEQMTYAEYGRGYILKENLQNGITLTTGRKHYS
jgi:hypothetical protein